MENPINPISNGEWIYRSDGVEFFKQGSDIEWKKLDELHWGRNIFFMGGDYDPEPDQ